MTPRLMGMATLADIHPVVPDKLCPRCQGERVTMTTQLLAVIYYNCSKCSHVWAEPRPHDSDPSPRRFLG